MDEKEKLLIDRTLSAVQQHAWAIERSVEHIANLLWDLREFYPPEVEQRVDYLLSRIPRLEKVRITDEREGYLRPEPGYLGPSRWFLRTEFPLLPFCPADPFRYDEHLRQLCAILSAERGSGRG